MFAFILGFLMGGAAGAAIVLATSPQFQYQGDSGQPSDSTKTDLQNEIKVRIDGAVEVGKKAAAEKVAELEELVRRQRGSGAEQED